MPTALYTTDVQKITDRTPKTTLTDTDVFVVANSSGTLAPITKVNARTTLGIKGNADAIATLQGYTKVSLGQETVERVTQATVYAIPILVCADGGALINLNGSLVKYNTAMEAQWTRTSFAAIYGREAPDGKLWLTKTDGVYVLTSEGIDVTSFTDEGDCLDIALDADGNFYTCHNRSSGKTLIKRDPDGVELWSKSVVPYGISVDIDSSGNIWMCGYATGVSCYKYAPDGTQLATIARTYPICIRTGMYDRIVVMARSNTQFYNSSGTEIVPLITKMAGNYSYYTRFSIIGRYIYGGTSNTLIKLDWDGHIVWGYSLVSSGFGRGAITNGNGLVYGGRASTGEDSFVVLREYHPINWRG